MFDEKVVSYVKSHVNYALDSSPTMRGECNNDYGLNFFGYITPLKVDTSRLWTITYNTLNIPRVVYLHLYKNKYGYTHCLETSTPLVNEDQEELK